MYVVYEGHDDDMGNKDLVPARYPECKVDKSWNNCEFESLETAAAYANNWLGIYGPGDDYEWCVGVEYTYFGCEFGRSFVVIKVLEIKKS